MFKNLGKELRDFILRGNVMDMAVGIIIGAAFGKIVDSVEAVKISDIPMDGNSYIFPKADGSEIYSKKWLPNFTTEISTYVKITENVEEKKEYILALEKADTTGCYDDLYEIIFRFFNKIF